MVSTYVEVRLGFVLFWSPSVRKFTCWCTDTRADGEHRLWGRALEWAKYEAAKSLFLSLPYSHRIISPQELYDRVPNSAHLSPRVEDLPFRPVLIFEQVRFQWNTRKQLA